MTASTASRCQNFIWALAIFGATASGASNRPRDKYDDWQIERELSVPMRDGAHLSTTIVRPKATEERLPAILVRAPYDDTSKLFGTWLWLDNFVRRGYIVVLQDERGRGFSDGRYNQYLQNAGDDGYDTIDWIAQQTWSNGRVGTLGCSSTAENQWPLAARNHPAHRAMITGAYGTAIGEIPGNHTQGGFFRGGVPKLGVWADWYSIGAPTERLMPPSDATQAERIRLRNSYSKKMVWLESPLRNNGELIISKFVESPSKDILRRAGIVLTPFDEYITWSPADSRWRAIELASAHDHPHIPALHLNTWHDGFNIETIRWYKFLQDRREPNQFLIIGPGPHCSQFNDRLTSIDHGGSDLYASYDESEDGYFLLFLRWFDYWLREHPKYSFSIPRVQLYTLNKGWQAFNRWPPKATATKIYFLHGTWGDHSRTKLLSVRNAAQDHADSYKYDPERPVEGTGGGVSPFPAGDQRKLMDQNSALSYLSEPLSKSMVVSGNIEVDLYVSSTVPDTDFMITLLDVYPDGKMIHVADDALRMRYRDGLDAPPRMAPGTVYHIAFSNMAASIQYQRGHRIGLIVTSSNVPLYERNMNTGGNNFDETTSIVANNTVHDGAKYPSRILLPVVEHD